jgi:hypothetical protein
MPTRPKLVEKRIEERHKARRLDQVSHSIAILESDESGPGHPQKCCHCLGDWIRQCEAEQDRQVLEVIRQTTSPYRPYSAETVRRVASSLSLDLVAMVDLCTVCGVGHGATYGCEDCTKDLYDQYASKYEERKVLN